MIPACAIRMKTMHKKASTCFLLLCGLHGAFFFSGHALALDPANIQAGPVLITPTFNSRIGYTDNLFRFDQEEEETGYSLLRPRVQAFIPDGVNTYSLTYEMADYRYFDSSDDNFTDHLFNLDVDYDFTARNSLDLYAEYWIGHEERGTGLSEGFALLIDEPIEVDRRMYGGDYTYGSDSSRGRINIGARVVDHQFQNFENFTRSRDRDLYRYEGTFFWSLGLRTDALIAVRYWDTEYDRDIPEDPSGTLNSEQFDYLVGLDWDATAKTSGSVKVGLYDRDYDSDAREDDDGFSWEVDVSYLPRTYSRIELESRRYFVETNGLGDSVDTKRTTLSWGHDWNSRTGTLLSCYFGEEDYTGVEREDDRWGAEATYTYAYRRWLDLGVGYRYEDRDSQVDFYDYSRNEVFVEITLGL